MCMLSFCLVLWTWSYSEAHQGCFGHLPVSHAPVEKSWSIARPNTMNGRPLSMGAAHSTDHVTAHVADTTLYSLCFSICRVFSLNPIQDYIPPTLTGHRSTPVGVFWAGTQPCIRA